MNAAVQHSIADRFERQAGYCGRMGSPLCDALLRSAAADYRDGGAVRELFRTGVSLEPLPRAGIRLLAALHYCALEGSAPAIASHFPSCGGDGDAEAAWDASRAFVEKRLPRVAELYRRMPQTNETARSMPLLGGLLAIVERSQLPVRLFEVGASAGLNTRLDRYRYEGAGWTWGDPSSPLVLRNREHGGKPPALCELRIVERGACDLHPLDVGKESDRLYLRSFIWADQTERLARFDAACKAALQTPMVVERADALTWIPQHFTPCAGSVTVVMHSIVAYYLDDRQRERFVDAVARAAKDARAEAPMAWLRFESDGFETKVTLWPDAGEIVIARSDGHAQGIEWK
jgi:hypothetical protein